METLKKIVKNEYFPAAAVLMAVVLFWIIAMFGGLSLLNNNQPPMATLTWMLFVYAAAVLTPLAGVLAAVNLVRRWQRNHQYAQAVAEAGWASGADEVAPVAEPEAEPAPVAKPEAESAPEQHQQSRPAPQSHPVPQQPAANHQPTHHQATPERQAKSQPLKKPAQSKQRKKAA